MARERMVTRTIETTNAKVLCMNIQSGTPCEKDVVLAGTFKDEKSLMKAVSKAVDNDTEKAVHVKTATEVQTLYGMTEADFIKLAKVMPAREAEATAEAK